MRTLKHYQLPISFSEISLWLCSVVSHSAVHPQSNYKTGGNLERGLGPAFWCHTCLCPHAPSLPTGLSSSRLSVTCFHSPCQLVSPLWKVDPGLLFTAVMISSWLIPCPKCRLFAYESCESYFLPRLTTRWGCTLTHSLP